jgi:ribonuclease Z
MSQLFLLGTGGAFNAPNRATTMLAFCGDTDGTIVVDCGGDVVLQMAKYGIDTQNVSALIVTHEHADHCTGFPLFIEKLWLSGRTAPFHIHALPRVIEVLRALEQLFCMHQWQNLSPLVYHPIEVSQPDVVVIDNVDFSITANQVLHPVPTIGLNVQVKASGNKITYSCDTAPCDVVTQMAKNATFLIHEATTEEACPAAVHSTFVEAATVAQNAQAQHLILVHLPVYIPQAEVLAAKAIFKGTLQLGEDGACFEI